MNERLLLVEDEPGLVRSLTDRLEAEGYTVAQAMDGAEGLQRALKEPFDLIILDVMLPKMQGFDVCRLLRQQQVETPILMLTARSHTTDKVVGLKLGADDYLAKPFEMIELLARVEALLRRARPASGPDRFAFGDIAVDVRAAEVMRNGATVELSAREFSLLRYLLEHPNEVLTRDQLLHDVWGYDDAPFTRTVDVHIAQLRNKLEANPAHPRHILTVHGLGYRFVD